MSQSVKSKGMPISVGSLLWIAVIVWLVTPSPNPGKRQLDALRDEVAELRQELGLLRDALGERSASVTPGSLGAGDARPALPSAADAGSQATPAASAAGVESEASTRAGSGAQAGSAAEAVEDMPVERE